MGEKLKVTVYGDHIWPLLPESDDVFRYNLFFSCTVLTLYALFSHPADFNHLTTSTPRLDSAPSMSEFPHKRAAHA